MKFRELQRILEEMGYTWTRGNGGHQVFTHPMADRPMIVPYDNREIGKPIVSKTLKKAKNAIKPLKNGVIVNVNSEAIK